MTFVKFTFHPFSIFCLGLVVFSASLLGIFSRPVGMLASIWPANAVLLGLMLRNPSLASPAGWLSAATGYVMADLVTGSGLWLAIGLNAANLIGVGLGYTLFMQLREEDRRLRRPLSVLYMFAVATAAGVCASVVGASASVHFFGEPAWTAYLSWLTTDLVNYTIVVPVFQTMPSLVRRSRRKALSKRGRALLANPLPLILLVLSCGAALIVGGPGAIAFPVPALIWCALSYGLFATTTLTMTVSLLTQMAVASDALRLGVSGVAEATLTSTRLGITLLALGPLTVASVDSARRSLIARLSHAVDYDFLTQCLARGAFMARANSVIAQLEKSNEPAYAMMIDIDHFKGINDTHGHAVGDRVLQVVARTIRANLRAGDLFGRLGGEEFAIVLVRQSPQDARAVAERVLHAVRSVTVDLEHGERLDVTASIGIATSMPPEMELAHLLSEADAALYGAKAAGRDRVVGPISAAEKRTPREEIARI
ncbi:GGDEF domain-containing protein [Sinorhizobium terangae]|uniref:GGDEF domain-containing protein n=1 Tax=Sinorhizobium terangae TaxID=110322 RepID=UPI0024B1E501|nr:sensor domain-containing diguanylate cyclase [Sinorhizobium terangae]WFU48726.1 diguanylate cyclase [Sinorhizobium terangae]